MKKKPQNEVKMTFTARSENESLARCAAASFLAQGETTVARLADVKCIVSEAVTNAIVHAYPENQKVRQQDVELCLKRYQDGKVRISVKDKGIGIRDLEKAREPLFTTDTTGERSGMGFAIMESLSDKLKVISKEGKGTCVIMWLMPDRDKADT